MFNYIKNKQSDVITHPCADFNGGFVKSPLALGMVYYIPYRTMDVITYPCPNVS